MVAVLSIQSHVAYGHVGNSSAVFPLQRLGIEVWPVHTVQFSNHTGYGEWRGRVFDGQAIEEVVDGIADRGVLGSCRSEEHTSELQSRQYLVCPLLLEKK